MQQQPSKIKPLRTPHPHPPTPHPPSKLQEEKRPWGNQRPQLRGGEESGGRKRREMLYNEPGWGSDCNETAKNQQELKSCRIWPEGHRKLFPPSKPQYKSHMVGSQYWKKFFFSYWFPELLLPINLVPIYSTLFTYYVPGTTESKKTARIIIFEEPTYLWGRAT